MIELAVPEKKSEPLKLSIAKMESGLEYVVDERGLAVYPTNAMMVRLVKRREELEKKNRNLMVHRLAHFGLHPMGDATIEGMEAVLAVLATSVDDTITGPDYDPSDLHNRARPQD